MYNKSRSLKEYIFKALNYSSSNKLLLKYYKKDKNKNKDYLRFKLNLNTLAKLKYKSNLYYLYNNKGY